jgi:hypothetical protein
MAEELILRRIDRHPRIPPKHIDVIQEWLLPDLIFRQDSEVVAFDLVKAGGQAQVFPTVGLFPAAYNLDEF